MATITLHFVTVLLILWNSPDTKRGLTYRQTDTAVLSWVASTEVERGHNHVTLCDSLIDFMEFS